MSTLLSRPRRREFIAGVVGRDEPLKVRTAADPTVLASLLEPLTPAAAEEEEEVVA